MQRYAGRPWDLEEHGANRLLAGLASPVLQQACCRSLLLPAQHHCHLQPCWTGGTWTHPAQMTQTAQEWAASLTSDLEVVAAVLQSPAMVCADLTAA